MSIVVRATPEEIEEGRKLAERVAELLGGREFVLVVNAGDIFSNMSDGHDFIDLLKNALESSLELRKSRQS